MKRARGAWRSSAGKAGATMPGGRFGRGAKPPSEGKQQIGGEVLAYVW